MSVTQVNITVSTILASFFSGAPTYLFYGMRLIQFPLGIFGVALASMLNGAILVAVLNRRLGGIDWRSVGQSAARATVAVVPVVLASAWVAGAAVWTHQGEWMAKTVMLFVGVGLSVTGYFGVHALMRSEELEVLWNIVKRKIGREA
jgi:putative peptidoglycan lipid II flippase